MAGEFRGHDRIIQAMAAHYHIGAMHPFDDGNGRTARALEAFMLRAAGVNDMVMVSLSNYYYEHQNEYLAALYESRESGHDLTPFLRFAILPAVAERCNALATEIATHSKRMLYREFAHSLFGRLRSPRRRALAERQLRILNVLLDSEAVDLSDLIDQMRTVTLPGPQAPWARDCTGSSWTAHSICNHNERPCLRRQPGLATAVFGVGIAGTIRATPDAVCGICQSPGYGGTIRLLGRRR